ncbi:MAG: DnaD domain protein [Lachnospiraceae bacterium]
MDVTYEFEVSVTVVSNEFIDRYMAAANGEYVKVYLYVLRHQQKQLELVQIADALNHTEADIRRALTYWEKTGVLKTREVRQQTAASISVSEKPAPAVPECAPKQEKKQRPVYSQEDVNKLASDEEFIQLLYIAQKYLNKVFTPRECEVYAYLFAGLEMSFELLEYLTEHCVQSGHTSIRYLETVALSWHEKGLHTVEEAKAYATGFTRDSFAVMKAFGLTDRRPGESEKDMIEKWFSVYGFTKDVVLEACNRTMSTIHSPSFRYADKILEQWQKAGVRNLNDVSKLDETRQKRPQKGGNRKPTNQFHNFEQRNTDYDAIVLDQVKSWIGEA